MCAHVVLHVLHMYVCVFLSKLLTIFEKSSCANCPRNQVDQVLSSSPPLPFPSHPPSLCFLTLSPHWFENPSK